MIKADIVRQISENLNLKDRNALTLVDATLESIKEVINRDGRLELRDFGVFTIKTRKARTGRNPRNLVEYPIPGRRVVTFRMGRELKKAGSPEESSPPVTGTE
jgi:nucleoid DNA-binding protein